jgi:hypothetical protein
VCGGVKWGGGGQDESRRHWKRWRRINLRTRCCLCQGRSGIDGIYREGEKSRETEGSGRSASTYWDQIFLKSSGGERWESSPSQEQ